MVKHLLRMLKSLDSVLSTTGREEKEGRERGRERDACKFYYTSEQGKDRFTTELKRCVG